MKTITKIEELMEELENLHGVFGFRGASEYDVEHRAEFEERGYLDCSFDLWDRRDCDYDSDAERLSGTSAIYGGVGGSPWLDEEEIKNAYEKALGYAKNHHQTDLVYLIRDDFSKWGDDEHEIILGSDGYGADIVAIVELEEE